MILTTISLQCFVVNVAEEIFPNKYNTSMFGDSLAQELPLNYSIAMPDHCVPQTPYHSVPSTVVIVVVVLTTVYSMWWYDGIMVTNTTDKSRIGKLQ